jgi:hypothetical protein
LGVLVPLLFAARAGGYPHPGGLVSGQHLAAMKSSVASGALHQAHGQLMALAKTALHEEPSAVKDFNVLPYYIFPTAHTAEKKRISDDALAAYTLALAYQLDTGSERSQYADKARQLMQAWATTNQTVNGLFDGDLVMCYAGVPMIHAAELLSDYGGWTSAERTKLKGWVASVFRTSANRIKGRENNWGDWGIFASIAAAYLLDDTAGVQADIARIQQKIASSIASDGHLPAETARGENGIWYTYFALTSKTAAAAVARNAEGVDLFNYASGDGRSFKLALTWYFPYCQNPSAWPFGEQKELPVAGDWPMNLYEVMSGVYEIPAWASWVDSSRPIMGSRGWIFATLLRPIAAAPAPDGGAPRPSTDGASHGTPAGSDAPAALSPSFGGGCAMVSGPSPASAAWLLLLVLGATGAGRARGRGAGARGQRTIAPETAAPSARRASRSSSCT